MSHVNTLKRYCLRALLRAGGPMNEEALLDACRQLMPVLLRSDFSQVMEGLEADGFCIGARDELDEAVSWALTVKGELRAKQL